MPKLIIRNVQMTILAFELDGKGTNFDPQIREKLRKQLIHAERFATSQDQLKKIISLQSIFR